MLGWRLSTVRIKDVPDLEGPTTNRGPSKASRLVTSSVAISLLLVPIGLPRYRTLTVAPHGLLAVRMSWVPERFPLPLVFRPPMTGRVNQPDVREVGH